MNNQDIIQRCDKILNTYKSKPKKPKKQAPLVELNKENDLEVWGIVVICVVLVFAFIGVVSTIIWIF